MENHFIIKYQNEKGEIYNWNGNSLETPNGFYQEGKLYKTSQLGFELEKCYLYIKENRNDQRGLVFPMVLPTFST